MVKTRKSAQKEASEKDENKVMAIEEDSGDSENDQNLVPCEGCDKKYSSVSAKNQHFKSKHQGRRYICSEPGCESEDFVSKFVYLRHMDRAHKNIVPTTKENEVFISHKTEMSDAAKNALIDRLKTELEEKDQIIGELKMKVKELELKQVKRIAPEIGLQALNQWIQSSPEPIDVLQGKLLEGDFLLSLNNEEINELVSSFVVNIRKPDGNHYWPDTVFYLVLSIQKYFLQNGKYLNIVFDEPCKRIAESLDRVVVNSMDAFLSSDPIHSRLEEEYLWECCQLGAFSPEMLLATIIYFNAKLFRLALDDQKQLKFSDIAVRSDMFTLFIQCKDHVYEQPLGAISGFKCPVKHYEYYLKKCPPEAKTEDNLMLLSPIDGCDPNDDFWFSVVPVVDSELTKYINRSKIIKEVIVSSL